MNRAILTKGEKRSLADKLLCSVKEIDLVITGRKKVPYIENVLVEYVANRNGITKEDALYMFKYFNN